MPKSNAPVNRNDYDTENKSILKGKEIYDKKLLLKKRNETNTLNNEIKYDKLKYHFENENRTPINSKGLIVH